MQNFFRSMVGGAAKRALPRAEEVVSKEPVMSLLEKQRMLEEAAIKARAGMIKEREEVPADYVNELFKLGDSIKGQGVNISADGVRVMDHREAWHENSRQLPGSPARQDLPSHVAARGGEELPVAGLPLGKSTMEDWSVFFTKVRHDPQAYTPAVLAPEHNLTETQVEAALKFHRSVLVLGNTKGQQMGAWGVPAGVHESGAALAQTGRDGWFVEDGGGATRHRG